jgi:hypothetical protein
LEANRSGRFLSSVEVGTVALAYAKPPGHEPL